jgi:hypothetical protein
MRFVTATDATSSSIKLVIMEHYRGLKSLEARVRFKLLCVAIKYVISTILILLLHYSLIIFS